MEASLGETCPFLSAAAAATALILSLSESRRVMQQEYLLTAVEISGNYKGKRLVVI